MPNKKHHRVLIWVVFLIVAATLSAQMLYPLDRAVPFAKINGENAAYQTEIELSGKLNKKFQASKLDIKLNTGKIVTYTLSETGAEQDTAQLTSSLTDYPFWQRLIPFSLLWQRPNVNKADVYFTESVLSKFSEDVATSLTTKPTNARLAIKDGELLATDDQPGYSVNSEDVKASISSAQFSLGKVTTVVVKAKQKTAKTTDADFAEVKTSAKKALSKTISITVGDETFSPDRKTVASWLVIGEDNKRPSLAIDKKRIKKYLMGINKKVGEPAGSTNVTIVDGHETKREKGKKGKAINSGELTKKIQTDLLNGEDQLILTAEFVELEPVVIYNSRYSATEKGLRTYVTDQSRNNTHIVIQQLNGNKWYAAARANESIPSASTYKVFVAMWLFEQMNKGKISWNDPWLDTTVSVCFDRMTIASTNECAQAWLASMGRQNMNSFVHSRGFSSGTTFTRADATHTTAADLAKLMIGINDGTYMSGANRARLYKSLSTHPYRYGIPTGSAGQVKDKVGFLWDYIHDAAIVTHPRGKYVMIVMTKGRSYAQIAEITRQVERIMYP